MMRNGLITVVLLVGMTLSLNAQTEEEAPTDISFERSISQTSVWAGDRVHYLITLTVGPDVKIAMGDFDEVNVSFEPFFLMELVHSEEVVGEQVRHVFDYLLANYEIGDKIVEIPGLIFRYETPGPVEANAATTKEMQIPPLPISVRSTLNQPLNESWILENLPITQLPIGSWVPLIAGLGGLLISTLPLGVWVWKKVPDWQARRRQLSRKQFLTQCSASIGQLEKRFPNNNAEIKDHYHDLEQIVGKYIHYFWDIQAQGLTHAELATRLKQGQLLPKQSEALSGVLDHGQSCRYAPDSSSGWEDTLRQDLQQIKQMCV